MHPIFKYLLVYMLLGAVGMYFGSRKKDKHIQKERWIKYLVYICITAILIAAILLDRFRYLILPVELICFFELVIAGKKAIPVTARASAGLIFLVTGYGCFRFASTFDDAFLLFVYFQVFIFDAFCQVTGQLLGKHKLMPAISPAKTIEGLAGGAFFCILSALIAAPWTGIPITTAFLYGCLTAGSCFSGDMLASLYKRTAGIKDYGKLLPGQGGFLDRFDSLIMTAAVYYFLFGVYGR